MEKFSKSTLFKILGVFSALLSVVLIGIVVYRGKMFVLPYNSVLVVCVALILAVIGFWVYVAVKGLDSVFVNDDRTAGE